MSDTSSDLALVFVLSGPKFALVLAAALVLSATADDDDDVGLPVACGTAGDGRRRCCSCEACCFCC